MYRERSFRSLPLALREKYFTPADGLWRVDPLLHNRVKWATVNLMDPKRLAEMFPVSVVFCRNVFIYFSRDAIVRTVQLFAEGLRGTREFVRRRVGIAPEVRDRFRVTRNQQRVRVR